MNSITNSLITNESGKKRMAEDSCQLLIPKRKRKGKLWELLFEVINVMKQWNGRMMDEKVGIFERK